MDRADSLTGAGVAEFVAGLPKAELHVHVEGSMTPELGRRLAERNGQPADAERFPIFTMGPTAGKGVVAPDTPPEVALAAFLAVYSASQEALRTEEDFHDLVVDYGRRRAEANVVYAEMFFDPQAHVSRKIPLHTVMAGLTAGMADADSQFGIETNLIMCFHRDRSPEDAMDMLRRASPWRESILGVGLDNNEVGGWVQSFQPVFDQARSDGYHLTSHCDCDMPDAAANIAACLADLGVERVDHGVNVVEDDALVALALEQGTCFTVCPTWRHGEAVPRRLPALREMLDRGLLVTVNSDDPGLFASGTLDTIMSSLVSSGLFDPSDLARLARNSFTGSWLPPARRKHFEDAVDTYMARVGSGQI